MTSSEKLQEKDPSLHPIFTRDPADFVQYLGKEVRVHTSKTNNGGYVYTGWVYTIDPVSANIVLITFDDATDKLCNVTQVMGHVVQSIEITDPDTEKHKEALENLFRTAESTQYTPEEVARRKDKLKSWLLKNRVPVEVSKENRDVLIVSDALTIEPPYEPENCQSTNEIILGRLQGLIKNMPKDVQDWE